MDSKGKYDLPIAYIITVILAIVFIPVLTDWYAETSGFATYEQQAEGKELCEASLPRDEHCIAEVLWLPVAR